MKATFSGNPEVYKEDREHALHTVTLPFRLVTARALIVRRRDALWLGTLHRPDGQYALPGGLVEDGESADGALLRELAEENIDLIDPEKGWQSRLVVDHYHGYGSLDLWYLIVVEEARFAPNDETVSTRWVSQSEDVWYPGMREKFVLALQRYASDLLRVQISVT